MIFKSGLNKLLEGVKADETVAGYKFFLKNSVLAFTKANAYLLKKLQDQEGLSKARVSQIFYC